MQRGGGRWGLRGWFAAAGKGYVMCCCPLFPKCEKKNHYDEYPLNPFATTHPLRSSFNLSSTSCSPSSSSSARCHTLSSVHFAQTPVTWIAMLKSGKPAHQ